jgi:putative endonuclease
MSYYVYLLASRKGGALYLGVTNDLVRRVYEHREKLKEGFSSRYNITKLVWFEVYDDPVSAITREKELKKWRRKWKEALFLAENPDWNDLYDSITQKSHRANMSERDNKEITGSLAARAPRNDGKTFPRRREQPVAGGAG